MSPNLVWLASYPRSGNTWFRIFLTILLKDEIRPPDAWNLRELSIASSRTIFDTHSGLSSADLNAGEIDALRPEVFQRIAKGTDDPVYMKIHDAFTRNRQGEYMFPPRLTRAVVYLVRNPLDVAVSFADYAARSLDITIENMCRTDWTLARVMDGLSGQLPQRQLTWSGHVRSWTRSPNRICLLRYEDMKLNPFDTFNRAVDFLGLEKAPEQVEMALDCCRFEVLKNLENKGEFSVKHRWGDTFFRKGVVGDWQTHMTPAQAGKIIRHHRKVMTEFGYLDKSGQPVF